MTVQLKRQV